MKKLLLFLLFLSCTALAQITITSSDFSAMYATGNTLTIYSDSSDYSVDIGTTGGGNAWDFTSLKNSWTGNLESVDPSSSPYISDYSGANVCLHTVINANGQTDLWFYGTLNGNLSSLGEAATTSAQSGVVTEVKNNPAKRQFELPVTFNSQWSTTYTQTVTIKGTQYSNSYSVTDNYVVDAYGTMTLPGGGTYDAIRVKKSSTTGTSNFVDYYFIAKNGAEVTVAAKDPNAATSGTITARETQYNGPMTTTDIKQTSSLPANYKLRQNYPNPFNPTTNITYSLPKQSFVRLKIYDILGNEVETLVNKEQSAGTYVITFEADNLASGFYIARLKAGNYVKTIKMTLLK